MCQVADLCPHALLFLRRGDGRIARRLPGRPPARFPRLRCHSAGTAPHPPTRPADSGCLGHELGHAEDHLSTTYWDVKDLPSTVINYPNSDKLATHGENQIRAENGMSLRNYYGLMQNANGSLSPDRASRLVDSAGNSVFGPRPAVPATVTTPATTVPYNYRTGR